MTLTKDCIRIFDKYKQNLHVEDEHKIYSYNVLVGIIHDTHIQEIDWWNFYNRENAKGKIFKKQSPTTKRHINYVAEQYNKPVISFVTK